MSKKVIQKVEILLQYSGGKDEPARGVFRNFPIDPAFASELVVAVAADDDPARIRWDSLGHGRPQIHLAGSARALEELGRYLIALARLETDDPDPSTSLEVSNADGGTARLLPRRMN